MTKSATELSAVAIGGALGALIRWGVMGELGDAGWSTAGSLLIVNVAGAFALGWFFSSLRTKEVWGPLVVAFAATGFLGSFTTFSGYILESIELSRLGSYLEAALLLAGSVVVGLAAAVAGRRLGER